MVGVEDPKLKMQLILEDGTKEELYSQGTSYGGIESGKQPFSINSQCIREDDWSKLSAAEKVIKREEANKAVRERRVGLVDFLGRPFIPIEQVVGIQIEDSFIKLK